MTMKINHASSQSNTSISPSFLLAAIVISFMASPTFAQYDVKNDRIHAPEVSHFAGTQYPGVDAQGDLHLSVPLLRVPGRGGLNFDITATYRSGIKVTQSASWIGLGWELDLGSITRQPLGGLDNEIQTDWSGALASTVTSQPDVYSVNLSGNSALLISTQLTLSPPPAFPYEPALSETAGPCSGTDYRQKNFVTSPWRPWKICTNGASSIQTDGYTTGCAGSTTQNDLSYFTIATEDGSRYVFKQPTLATATLPSGGANGCSNGKYQFVSTWRLVAVLAKDYTGPEIPDATSNGGWMKVTYRTWNETLLPSQENDSNAKEVDTIYDGGTQTILAQITYPYYIETPTHFAAFKTSKRYDRDLAVLLDNNTTVGNNQNYYSRKLDKIRLFKKTLSLGVPIVLQAGQSVESYGAQIMETSFKYLQNGADSLWAYSASRQGQMLSKLTLTEMATKGISGSNNLSLPSYKFLYYDVKDLNPNTPNPYLSWWDVLNHDIHEFFVFQDDFGFFDPPPGSPFYSSLEARGLTWSLKEITYPEGGRHFFVYESDALSSTNFSYAEYKYVSAIPRYFSSVSNQFSRYKQGGARVKVIRKYEGFANQPDTVIFNYHNGHHSSISEVKFNKLGAGADPFYFSGDRGQSNVADEWVEKKFIDGSRIRTYYRTADGAEPQTLYKGSDNQLVILSANTRWNWGETIKTEYYSAGNSIVKDETPYWTYKGHSVDGTPIRIATLAPALTYYDGLQQKLTDPIYLNFTHKQVDSLVTKHYFDSQIVKAKEAYVYNADGAILSSKTETSDDGKARRTDYIYAYEVAATPPSPYSAVKDRNMRTQTAQTRIATSNGKTGYSSNITSWKAVTHNGQTKYLPDTEYHWRTNITTNYAAPTFLGGTPQPTTDWIATAVFSDYDEHGNLKKVFDAYNAETTVFWDATSTLIDSITTRPNATTTLTTRYAYDPNTFKLTSTTDPNGQKTEYKYDPLQRLIQTIMPDKRVASELAYYYSRQGVGNNEAFNATDPNYVKTRALGGAEFFEAFEYTDTTANHGWGVHFSTSPGSMKTVYDNTLQSRVLRVDVISGSNEGYAVKYPATGELNTKSKHLWVKTKSNLGNSSFRVVVVRDGLEYSLRYYFDNGTNGYDSGSRFITIYLGAAFKDGNWHTLERDLEQDFKLTNLSTSYEYVKRVVAVGEYDLDNIQLQNHPVTSFAFADGVGRGIQTLQYDSTGAIKAGTFYDTQDRVVKVTKPFWHGNTKFVRVDSVIDYANSYYSTKHPAYHDSLGVNEFDTGTHAYTETDYFPDPLHRVRHQYAPGDTFSSAGNRYVKYRYGTNVAGEMGITNAASVFETRLFDENGVKTEIFTDTFGNKVAVRNDSGGPNNNGNTSKLATAFQYDIVNNLTKIAPPKAFNIADNNTPDWNSVFCTVMTYNSLSQLTSRQTPDAGTDSMFYDKKGNLRFIKDANGQAASTKYFIYYKYDNLNRKTEEGTLTVTSPTNFNQSNADDPSFPTAGAWKVKYYYDVSIDPNQRNLKSRLYRMDYKTDRYPNMTGYIFYSYDANGNVEWTRQNIPKSNVNDGNGYLNAQIDYQYDALGKVTKTYFRRTFPPGVGSNAFYLWYDYDAMGRLENVYTNTADARIAPPNARYTYWPGGQVKRLVVGGSAQGVDYLYNSRDWLTQINHQNLWHTQDPGGDGGPGSNVYNVDRFGQIIGYNKQKQIATGHADFAAQFNGNISWTIHRTTGNVKPVAVNSNLTGWVFKYDKANRLTKSNWGHYTTSWQTSNRYDLTGIVYDRHGNLEYMTRYDTASVATNMDYLYTANTNKLHQISGLNGQGANNYTYDANGNMISDKKKLGTATGDTIAYDYRNLPYRVTKSLSPAGTINFGYDGKGQRVSKNNLYYVPGLDGRVVAVYDVNGTLLCWNLWGLDLIGQRFWKQ